jgi:hypothetical protein
MDLVKIIGTIKFSENYDVNENRLVEPQTDHDSYILNVESFSTGIYIVKVKSTDSNWIGKFCKK